MTDLRVDYGLLEDARASLRVIATEFARAGERCDASARIWGAEEVRDAMSAFVDDWRRHRRLLGEDLEAFGARVEGMITGFRDTDRNLGDVFRRPDAGGSAPPGAAR